MDINYLLNRIRENITILRETGWIVSEPRSPEWWGGLKTPGEIAISAFLVQMTRWETVVKVIEKLRSEGLNSPESISSLKTEEIEKLIRPVNFYKTKARRIKSFSEEVLSHGGLENFLVVENRNILLSLEGIGEETADSLLLYAGNQLFFPPSEYLRRVLSRVEGRGLSKLQAKNEVILTLPRNLFTYKLFHAGIVAVGKRFCLLKCPKCETCFLNSICKFKV
ncbi:MULTISPECIES: endonuclease III domain-containing protein [Acidianus]|uniref:DNA endonuclease III n=1 Tax=Candidatus Acidianus copahuensis TaxID=1160895 RepID=A0A031LKR6_9CREN|nr:MULTISPECIES: DNA endonuclease III [Acidianus]EZQ01799.1 DNA endonuclease III [Candidatus Acidianus copahuensis]NON62141.1 endonuclease III domain-containing protein [Acidianus sp. RZ1]